MNAHLTDQDRAELARILRNVIEPTASRSRRKCGGLKELLAKLDPTPERVVTPYVEGCRAAELSVGEEAAALKVVC